jgi:hypothetical protein
MSESERGVLYFGGWSPIEQPGHHLQDAYGQHLPLGTSPWGTDLDGGLCPRAPGGLQQRQGYAELHHCQGWTALAFWDRTFDTRPNSSSALLIDRRVDAPELVRLARLEFPAVFRAWDAAGLVIRVAGEPVTGTAALRREASPVRIAFDIGGVISKYPEILLPLIRCLVAGGAAVHVVTDMPDRGAVMRLLADNDVSIPPERVHLADYNTWGEGCKAEVMREISADILIDDHLGYLVADGCPVRLFVVPDPDRPYHAPNWVAPTTPFATRVYRPEQCRERMAGPDDET